MSAELRPAEPGDLAEIAAIYAHWVETTAVTFDLEAPGVAEWRERFARASELGHPWMVSALDGGVAGYALTSAFRTKAAYRMTVECTIYLDRSRTGLGLGRPLYAALLDEARARGLHLAVAGMTLPNAPSAALHASLGFRPVGVFEQVGYKLGAWHDVAWYQLHL